MQNAEIFRKYVLRLSKSKTIKTPNIPRELDAHRHEIHIAAAAILDFPLLREKLTRFLWSFHGFYNRVIAAFYIFPQVSSTFSSNAPGLYSTITRVVLLSWHI